MDSLDDLLGLVSPLEEDAPRCVLLIDGDIVAFRSAAATDGRMYTIKDSAGLWKYKKDVEEAAKERGLSLGDICITYVPEPLTHALNATRLQMQSIIGCMEAKHNDFCDVEVYLTDSSANFRLDINPMYKANRIDMHRPAHLKACKDYLVCKYEASYSGNKEADDMIAIRATKLKEAGRPYVICSIDKDFNQIVGWHFDWVKEEYWYVDEERAKEFLWGQVVTGDQTDNISVPEGIGPAKAKKLFEGVNWATVKEDELYEMVTGLYGEYLLKCGKLKKDKGILATKDLCDVRCWVEETMSQVYLLREYL